MPYLQNMKPRELDMAIEQNLPLLVGVGTIEYHGSQLPLGTDLLFVEGTLREIEKRIPVVIAPSFSFSPNGYAVSGPEKGTVDISVDCFINYVGEILNAYKQMGFRTIRIYVHHQGGNIKTFIETAILKFGMYNQQNVSGNGWWTKKASIPPVSIEVCGLVGPDPEESKTFFGHGGKGETQAMLAVFPETVKMEYLTDNEPFWNEHADEASQKEAECSFELLVNNHVKKLKADVSR